MRYASRDIVRTIHKASVFGISTMVAALLLFISYAHAAPVVVDTAPLPAVSSAEILPVVDGWLSDPNEEVAGHNRFGDPGSESAVLSSAEVKVKPAK